MDQPFDEYSRSTIVSKEHQAQSPTSARVLPQTHQHHSHLCKRWILKHIETPRKIKGKNIALSKASLRHQVQALHPVVQQEATQVSYFDGPECLIFTNLPEVNKWSQIHKVKLRKSRNSSHNSCLYRNMPTCERIDLKWPQGLLVKIPVDSAHDKCCSIFKKIFKYLWSCCHFKVNISITVPGMKPYETSTEACSNKSTGHKTRTHLQLTPSHPPTRLKMSKVLRLPSITSDWRDQKMNLTFHVISCYFMNMVRNFLKSSLLLMPRKIDDMSMINMRAEARAHICKDKLKWTCNQTSYENIILILLNYLFEFSLS